MFDKEVTEMIYQYYKHFILIDKSINLTDVLLQIVITFIFILTARVGQHCRSVGTGGGEEDQRHFLPTVLNAAQWQPESEGQSGTAGERADDGD